MASAETPAAAAAAPSALENTVITMPMAPTDVPPPPAAQITPRSLETQIVYVDFLENKLNSDIGWFYWKKYVAAAVWAQISMPINLAITLMTALTTAQANAPNLLPDQIYKNLTYVVLVLTVLNTFFRPHEKLQNNVKYMKEWGAIGIAFEKIYYSDIQNSGATGAASAVRNGPQAAANAARLATEYGKLQDAANALRQKEGPDMINFFTDLIHILCYYTCMRKYRRWLDKDGVTRAS